MSFQHFRLGEITPIQHHGHLQQQPPQPIPTTTPISSTKQPYGSGDTEDGYTLIFTNMDEFQVWRQGEEERNSVEFVKGDTHGSKADPPRFKDHTKLVCARHSRSGRKKYIKKHPERVRKVPSRKLEGVGCQASISYKTYFDSEQVRACYIAQHSHPIGPENLPFTRRGRKAAAQAEKDRGRNKSVNATEPQLAAASGSNTASAPVAAQPVASNFTSAVSMLAPLPAQTFSPAPQQQTAFNYPPGVEYGAAVPNQERWDNMNTLFSTVREHARSTHYPAASVAALETVLIRLYLESPIGNMPQAMNLTTMVGGAIATQQPNGIPMQGVASTGGPNSNPNVNSAS